MTNDDVRIGDAEREQVAQRLHVHVGTGRLDLAEFERRVDAVYAARTRGELASVLADLPERAPRPAAPRPTRGRIVAAAWAPWVLASTISMVVWLATSLGAGALLYFWPIWVMGPWGAVLLLGPVAGAAALPGCRTVAPRA
ncbi:DUF1707 SHOCT-like domain-containing protein [Pseudonocardia sp. CA-107938]|uniref:DUF1707 SHOCT-like domain-containing protein n=1 Tax=Pseudonocardia sp. CA-107938 TaxID=3240021 RepID=UPI003D8AC3A5